MFKSLLNEINLETVSLIWKAIPEMQGQAGQVQTAQKEKSKFDMSKAQTQHADSTNMGFKGTPSPAGQQEGGAARAPGEKRQPVSVEDEPGRNDYVKVQNLSSSQIKKVKWKFAKKMVEEDGWILIEK